MRRHVQVCTVCAFAMMALSTTSYAGEWKDNELPFAVSIPLLGWGSCEGPSGMQGSVACHWWRAGDDLHKAECGIRLGQKTFSVSVDIRRNQPDHTVLGPLEYFLKGVKCKAGVSPILVQKAQCSSNNQGLVCSGYWFGTHYSVVVNIPP